MKENPKEYLREIINDSNQRFKLIIDSLPHFVWESDRDGTYSYVNQQFLDWSALTLEQIADDGLSSPIYPEGHKMVVDTWQQALITQTEYSSIHWRYSFNYRGRENRAFLYTW